jgi:hypothetical protein
MAQDLVDVRVGFCANDGESTLHSDDLFGPMSRQEARDFSAAVSATGWVHDVKTQRASGHKWRDVPKNIPKYCQDRARAVCRSFNNPGGYKEPEGRGRRR